MTEAPSILKIYEAVLDKQKAERQAPPKTSAAPPTGADPAEEVITMSGATDAYLAELEEAEARAAGLFEEAGPDGAGLDQRARALISHMRGALKQHRKGLDRMREEARTQARAELFRERQTEAGFRGLNVPPSARALFSDVDPTDQAAMAARADELREAGVSWPGQPRPSAPPPPDPSLVAQVAMQQAAAGGVTLESAGDLKTRMRKIEANPKKYTFEQHEKVVGEYNAAVEQAARRGGAGVLGWPRSLKCFPPNWRRPTPTTRRSMTGWSPRSTLWRPRRRRRRQPRRPRPRQTPTRWLSSWPTWTGSAPTWTGSSTPRARTW